MEYQQAEKLFMENNLSYSKEIHNKLNIYYEFLMKYNKKINLTAITDENEVWIKHFIDSILIEKYADIKLNSTVIDVGTGAGFPSVPLKIYRDDINLILMDSINKRINFLNELSKQLNINVQAFHLRAEDGANKVEFREKFDIVVARAVASMPVLCEYCMGFLNIGGKFIAMKGVNEEIKEFEKSVSVMGGEIDREIKYKLNNTDDRKIFIIKKISHTPSKYPRNSSQIKNKPL